MGGQNSKVSYAAARKRIADDIRFLHNSYVEDANKIVDGFETAGKDNNLLNLTCLEELMELLVGAALNATKIINEHTQENIWKDKVVLHLVNEFLNNTESTLNFLVELEQRVRRAETNQSTLQSALVRFDEGINDGNSDDVTVLSATLDGVKIFLRADVPFDEDFTNSIQKIRVSHEKMSKTLKRGIQKLDKRSKKNKVKSSVLCSMLAIVAATILVVTIVELCLTQLHPVLGCFGVGIAGKIAAAGKRVHKKCKKKEITLKKQRETLQSMDRATVISIVELKNIHTNIKSLENKLEHMLNTGTQALNYGDNIPSLKKLMDPLRESLPAFGANIESLCKQIEKCRYKIMEARESLVDAEKPSCRKQ